MKKQVSIALAGLLCGGYFVTDIEANAQGNTENQNEAPTYNLNERSSKKTGVVTATSLNVRKGASTSHTIIGSLKKGDSVEIVSSDSSGWCKIKYGSGYGYISEQYISITSDSNNDTSSSTTVTHTGNVNASSLNVRDGASSNYNKLGSLARGTTINIVDKMSNGWYKIKFRNGYGYVSGDYITDVKPVNTSSDSNDTSSATTVTHTGKVDATSLNVRSGANSSYSKIGSIRDGSTVNIVGKMSNGWYKIKFGNGYGYVSASYISDVTPASGSNDSSDSTVVKTGTVNTGKMSNGWYKIKYGNGYGYVSGDYITDVKPIESSNDSNDTSSSTTVTHTGRVKATALNVRNGAGTSYAHIGTLLKGTTVNIVDKMSNGWYKIKFGNGYGYVSASYISDVTPASGSNDSSDSTVVKTGTVNTMSNGWYKIKFGNGYGYVSASYISDVTPASGSNDSSDSTVVKTGTVNTNSLNVRSGASTSYSKIGTLSRGAKVEIVNTESNGWYKIKFGNGYGYVSSSYIDIEGERNNLNNFLFIGDSFTVGIQNIIKSKNNNAYVYAKSGSRPSYWLDKVDSMPSSSKIDGVCLLIGVNGASTSANKSDVKTLINKLSAKYPDKTIYVQKVFPVGRAFTGANPASFNKSIASLNSVIESHCETKSNVKFIDTTTGFVDSNGYLIHHNGDGLHIAGSYSNTFYNNILNAIKRAE